MGGFGTWDLASYSPERFAAIAPICGGGDATKTVYTIGDKIPAWVFHGAKDSVVPLVRSKELVDGFKKRGVDVKFTVYPDSGHDSWSETYNNPELYQWMLSHSIE
jgi:predicted peptidase